MATRFPQLVTLKLPTAVVEMARQQAWADDRSLSAYLRRIITDAVDAADHDAVDAADQDMSPSSDGIAR